MGGPGISDPIGWEDIKNEISNDKTNERHVYMKYDFEELSGKEKDEILNYMEYLHFKERRDEELVGKITFDQFKKYVYDEINEDVVRERIVFENFTSESGHYSAELLYNLDSNDNNIIYIDATYGYDDERLEINCSTLFEDMVEAIVKYKSKR